VCHAGIELEKINRKRTPKDKNVKRVS